MTPAPTPRLLRLRVVMEPTDAAFARAIAAGVAAEALAGVGLAAEPAWRPAEGGGDATPMGPIALRVGPGPAIEATIRLDRAGPGFAESARLLAAMMRAFHEEGAAEEAILERVAADVFPLPRPPLFEDAHGLIASHEEVAASYERPVPAADIPGVEIVEAHGRLLMLRALDAADQATFLTAVEPGQMELARGARAGLTDYARGAVPDWAEAAIRTGDSGLVWRGVEGGRATWTCPERGRRPIRAFDLLDLARLREAGLTPQGEPVTGLRVVFPDRMDALQEKRPLLDLGVEIALDLGPLGLRPLDA